jgi:protein-histidine pros-kinase
MTEAQIVDELVDARTRELSELATHLQELAEKERSDLARKLHDELGGLLTAAKMDLSWLQSRLEATPIQERLTQLGAVLDEAMDLKRRVVDELRPSLLDHFGLSTALRSYLDATCAKAGLTAEAELPDQAPAMPKDTAIALFRIAQEALTNAIRHAHATHVRLTLTEQPQRYVLTLSDDGRGFDVQQVRAPSTGLSSMRQRVRSLGGQLSIDSGPGRGTSLRVEMPVAAQ